MGRRTDIGWCEATWNPWQGCHKVSLGCKRCYMFEQKRKFGQDPTLVKRSAPPTFRAPLGWPDPLHIFACSWSDWFIEDADEWRPEAWEIIRATARHQYLLLTKRPENIASRLPSDWGQGWPNVWLGISAEDQRRADERIPPLLATSAALRFLSLEPLLSPIDLLGGGFGQSVTGIGLVIVGGESGPNARPMEIDWLARIVKQCRDAGIPAFVKQASGLWPGRQGEIPDELWAIQEIPR